MRVDSDNFLLYIITFFVISMATFYALLFYIFLPTGYGGTPQCSDTRSVSCDETTVHTTSEELKFNLRLQSGSPDVQQVSVVERGQKDYCDYEQLPSPQKVYHVVCPLRDSLSYTYQVDLEDDSSSAGYLELNEPASSGVVDNLPAPSNVYKQILSDRSLILLGDQITFYSAQNPDRLLLQSILEVEPYDAVYSEGILYVLTQNRLKIYDMKDPVSPFLLTDMSMRDAQNLHLQGQDTLFISALDRYFVFDVSNPSFPQRISQQEQITEHIYTENNTVYTVYEDEITLVKGQDKAVTQIEKGTQTKERFILREKEFHTIPLDRTTKVGFPVNDITKSEDTIYVAAGYGNIQRYNYTTGEKLPQISLPGDALTVAVKKDTLTSLTTEGLISYKI